MRTRATLDKPLSRRQEEVYEFIHLYIEEKGYGLTIREIADHFMMASGSTAHGYVERLISKGYLTHSSGGVRTLALTSRDNRPKVVTQAGILKWIDQQSNDQTRDAVTLLTDLQEGIQTGRIR